jgi:hypothetical protein
MRRRLLYLLRPSAILFSLARARGASRRLREIVLILAHADRLGINLDQLGERVLKPPCDRDRSAQGHI